MIRPLGLFDDLPKLLSLEPVDNEHCMLNANKEDVYNYEANQFVSWKHLFRGNNDLKQRYGQAVREQEKKALERETKVQQYLEALEVSKQAQSGELSAGVDKERSIQLDRELKTKDFEISQLREQLKVSQQQTTQTQEEMLKQLSEKEK